MQLCCRRKLNRHPLWVARLKSGVVELSFLPGIIQNETLTLMTHKAESFRHHLYPLSYVEASQRHPRRKSTDSILLAKLLDSRFSHSSCRFLHAVETLFDYKAKYCQYQSYVVSYAASHAVHFIIICIQQNQVGENIDFAAMTS